MLLVAEQLSPNEEPLECIVASGLLPKTNRKNSPNMSNTSDRTLVRTATIKPKPLAGAGFRAGAADGAMDGRYAAVFWLGTGVGDLVGNIIEESRDGAPEGV